MSVKLRCRIFGHKWGYFLCRRCGVDHPSWAAYRDRDAFLCKLMMNSLYGKMVVTMDVVSKYPPELTK